MNTVKLASNGHVKLQEDCIRHLGLSIGDEMVVTKLLDGSLRLSKAVNLSTSPVVENKTKKTWRDFAGCLHDKTEVRLSIEELEEAIANSATKASLQGLN